MVKLNAFQCTSLSPRFNLLILLLYFDLFMNGNLFESICKLKFKFASPHGAIVTRNQSTTN